MASYSKQTAYSSDPFFVSKEEIKFVRKPNSFNTNRHERSTNDSFFSKKDKFRSNFNRPQPSRTRPKSKIDPRGPNAVPLNKTNRNFHVSKNTISLEKAESSHSDRKQIGNDLRNSNLSSRFRDRPNPTSSFSEGFGISSSNRHDVRQRSEGCKRNKHIHFKSNDECPDDTLSQKQPGNRASDASRIKGKKRKRDDKKQEVNISNKRTKGPVIKTHDGEKREQINGSAMLKNKKLNRSVLWKQQKNLVKMTTENQNNMPQRMTSFQKAMLEYKNKQSLKEDSRKEVVKKKQEQREAMVRYKKKKKEKFVKLLKKTKKGQPIMKERIEMLLEKIQRNIASEERVG